MAGYFHQVPTSLGKIEFCEPRTEQEAAAIYELSLAAFAHRDLYTPIPRAEFLAQYAAVRPHLRPELCLLAEHQGRLVGFLFAVPDLLQRERGEAIDTVIIKTVAVLPGRLYAGLGSYLVEQVRPSLGVAWGRRHA